MARQLALGARLDAVITAAAPKGKILIDPAYGRVAIQTGFPLPKDGALQLQLQAKGGSFQFLITAIHGMPPKTALRALGLIPSAAGKSSGAPSPAAPPPGGGRPVRFPHGGRMPDPGRLPGPRPGRDPSDFPTGESRSSLRSGAS